jgi:hypothetical protein
MCAANSASKTGMVAKKLANAGFNVIYKNPQEFSNLINEHWTIYARSIKQSGMKVD